MTDQQLLEHAHRLQQSGHLAQAEVLYRDVLTRYPSHPDLLHALGVLTGMMGRPEEAIALIRRAIALNPNVAEYHNNLGESCRRARQWPQAIAGFRRAVELKPDYADAYNNLGTVLRQSGRPDEALAALARAIELRPDGAENQTSLGNLLWTQGRPDEAIAAYRRAIAINPAYSEAHNSLGVVLLETGRVPEAIASMRNAVAAPVKLDPTQAASNLLFALHYQADGDPQALLEEHLAWARQHAAPLAGEIKPHENDRTPDRTLRVGFLSPDFHEHPVGHLLLALFGHLDRSQVTIIAYSSMPADDPVTKKLKHLTPLWRDIFDRTDHEVADLIRGDRIDILVDLALHTEDNRLLVFARKPAPVQVTMLGMPSTTGLLTIDYRLTDAHLDPPALGNGPYSERSVRLPHGYWCYQPPAAADAPPVVPPPSVERGFLTFGCLNRFMKVSPPAREAWLKILASLPSSRLLLHAPPGSHREAFIEWFAARGIARGRVAFVPQVALASHLLRYQELDLCLDPFPYNGGVTTMDALWMGVPVISLAGNLAVGRAGLSILNNVGLPELVARTPEEYVKLAVELARDTDRLAALRNGMRGRMNASPLMDAKGYAAAMAEAFRGMWTEWCSS